MLNSVADMNRKEGARTTPAAELEALRAKVAQLEEQSAAARAITMSSLDPLIAIDDHGVIRLASDSVQRVFGWSPAELVGRNITVLMPEPHHSMHDRYLESHRRTGITTILNRTREFEVVRRDGSRILCDLSVSRA